MAATKEMFSVNGLTPGAMTLDAAIQKLSRWHPRISLDSGPLSVWFIDGTRSAISVENVKLDTLWLISWENQLAAVEGDFSRRSVVAMRRVLSRRWGVGRSAWDDDISSGLVEVDDAGRCYFQIAHKALLERYNQGLSRRLTEERSRYVMRIQDRPRECRSEAV